VTDGICHKLKWCEKFLCGKCFWFCESSVNDGQLLDDLHCLSGVIVVLGVKHKMLSPPSHPLYNLSSQLKGLVDRCEWQFGSLSFSRS
jgi:hypothetical protein